MQTKVDVFFNSPKFCTKFSNCVQKLGGASEKFKDCLSTWLVQEPKVAGRRGKANLLFLSPCTHFNLLRKQKLGGGSEKFK